MPRDIEVKLWRVSIKVKLDPSGCFELLIKIQLQSKSVLRIFLRHKPVYVLDDLLDGRHMLGGILQSFQHLQSSDGKHFLCVLLLVQVFLVIRHGQSGKSLQDLILVLLIRGLIFSDRLLVHSLKVVFPRFPKSCPDPLRRVKVKIYQSPKTLTHVTVVHVLGHDLDFNSMGLTFAVP